MEKGITFFKNMYCLTYIVFAYYFFKLNWNVETINIKTLRVSDIVFIMLMNWSINSQIGNKQFLRIPYAAEEIALEPKSR